MRRLRRGGQRLARRGGTVGHEADLLRVNAGRLSSAGVAVAVDWIERRLVAGPVEDHEAVARQSQRGADPAQAVFRIRVGVGRRTHHARSVPARERRSGAPCAVLSGQWGRPRTIQPVTRRGPASGRKVGGRRGSAIPARRPWEELRTAYPPTSPAGAGAEVFTAVSLPERPAYPSRVLASVRSSTTPGSSSEARCSRCIRCAEVRPSASSKARRSSAAAT